MDSLGAGNRNLFELDTKDICLLCLRKCSSSSCSEKVAATNASLFCDSSSSAKSTDTSGERERAFQSFKMLMRYLNVDILQQCNFSPSFLQSVDGLQRDVLMVVKMCSVCLKVCQEFRQIYKQFEIIRLQLDKCVQGLYDMMQSGDNNKERVREYERLIKEGAHWNPLMLFHASIADNLRRETMRKCLLKVQNLTPKVTVSKPINSDDTLDYCLVPSPSPICVITETKGDLENDVEFEGPMSMVEVETSYVDVDGDLNEITDSDHVNKDRYSDFKDFVGDPLANGNSSPSSMPWTTSHHPSSTSSFPDPADCLQCGKRFSNKSNLKIHQSYAHTLETYSDQLPDGTSSERLKTAIDSCVDRHRRIPTKGSMGQPRFLCGFCSKNYRDKFTLKIHTLENHFNEIIIALATPSTSTENITPAPHSKTVAVKRTGIGVKRRRGRGRGARNGNRGGVKPEYTGPIYKCPICRKDFTVKACMKRHFKVYHTREGSKMFRCAWCDKVFVTGFNMRSHVNSVHLFISNEDKLPPGTTELQLRTAIKMISNEQTTERDPHKSKTGLRCNYCGKMCGEPFFFRTHLVEYHFHEVVNRLNNFKDTLDAEIINGDSSSSQLMIQQDDHDVATEDEEEELEMKIPIENFRHTNILDFNSLTQDNNEIVNVNDYHDEQDQEENPMSSEFNDSQQHQSTINSQKNSGENVENEDDGSFGDVPPVLDLYDDAIN